jgi:protein-L-isoaspartate(D-aspartate) O-methyltransferase
MGNRGNKIRHNVVLNQYQGIGMTSMRTRQRLVERLEQEGIQSSEVLEVIRLTPRHLFMDEALASRAYEDTALPISYGQTISQPLVVAMMTEALLQIGKLERVLEVGTGSGYQTAILAQLVDQVYTVERIHGLFQLASSRLNKLAFDNIHFHHSDGCWGWQEYAPFDGILVTAAPDEVPEELLQQLRVGGRLIIPAGTGREQVLWCYTRTHEGFDKQMMGHVCFVPLVSGVTT